MSQSRNALLLADNHRRRQVAVATQTQRALAQAWERTMYIGDLDRSFQVFYRVAQGVIGSGRRLSLQEAQRYYIASARNAGVALTGSAARLSMPSLSPARLETSLRVSGPVTAKQALVAGHTAPAAMSLAEAGMLSAAKRHIIDASRLGLIDKIVPREGAQYQRSSRVRYARVSDGDPCAWCAMFIARGAVYTEAGVDFETHDGCGCNVRMVWRGEAELDPQAERYRELLDVTGGTEAYRDRDAFNEWRRGIAAAKRDGDSIEARILRGEA